MRTRVANWIAGLSFLACLGVITLSFIMAWSDFKGYYPRKIKFTLPITRSVSHPAAKGSNSSVPGYDFDFDLNFDLELSCGADESLLFLEWNTFDPDFRWEFDMYWLKFTPADELLSSPFLFTLPHYQAMLLAGVFPMWRVCRWAKRCNLQERGICLHCGYDLRASTNTCPECGEVIPKPDTVETT